MSDVTRRPEGPGKYALGNGNDEIWSARPSLLTFEAENEGKQRGVDVPFDSHGCRVVGLRDVERNEVQIRTPVGVG